VRDGVSAAVCVNDLEPPAQSVLPKLAQIKRALQVRAPALLRPRSCRLAAAALCVLSALLPAGALPGCSRLPAAVEARL
jgi:hypothetical protein